MDLELIPKGKRLPIFKGLQIINEAIKAAEKASTDSQNAIDTANAAKDSAEQTRTELDEAILSGDSSPLAGQLSVGADAVTYDSAQERFLQEHEQVTSQLAEKAKIVLSVSEPSNADDDTFWYEDKGEAPINFNPDSGVSVVNATISDTEPSDTNTIWFDVEG